MRALVKEAVDAIAARLGELDAAPDPGLDIYARDALKKART